MHSGTSRTVRVVFIGPTGEFSKTFETALTVAQIEAMVEVETCIDPFIVQLRTFGKIVYVGHPV